MLNIRADTTALEAGLELAKQRIREFTMQATVDDILAEIAGEACETCGVQAVEMVQDTRLAGAVHNGRAWIAQKEQSGEPHYFCQAHARDSLTLCSDEGRKWMGAEIQRRNGAADFSPIVLEK